MKKIVAAVMCTLMLLGTLSLGYAQQGDWRGGIRSRIHEARTSIMIGIDNGTLTRREARQLNGELDYILDRIDRMRSDGHLSRGERERVNYDLDKLERNIRREKHDDDTRYSRHRYRYSP